MSFRRLYGGSMVVTLAKEIGIGALYLFASFIALLATDLLGRALGLVRATERVRRHELERQTAQQPRDGSTRSTPPSALRDDVSWAIDGA